MSYSLVGRNAKTEILRKWKKALHYCTSANRNRTYYDLNTTQQRSPVGYRHNDVHVQPFWKVMSTAPTRRLRHFKLNYLPILPYYHNL